MNEKALEFIKSLGAWTEIWILTYNNFRKQDIPHEAAMEHTREFLKTMMNAVKEE